MWITKCLGSGPLYLACDFFWLVMTVSLMSTAINDCFRHYSASVLNNLESITSLRMCDTWRLEVQQGYRGCNHLIFPLSGPYREQEIGFLATCPGIHNLTRDWSRLWRMCFGFGRHWYRCQTFLFNFTKMHFLPLTSKNEMQKHHPKRKNKNYIKRQIWFSIKKKKIPWKNTFFL